MTRTSPALLAPLLAVALLAACTAPGSADEGADAPATRVAAGAYGDVEVPVEPQRIVADLMTVDYLTALGYDTSTVVGVFEGDWFQQDEDHYLHDFFAANDPTDPGNKWEMNLEAVIGLDPDLILVPFDQIDGAEQQDELGRIAPLLVVPTSAEVPEGARATGDASFQDWRGTLRAYGDVLDRQDEAEAYIAGSDALIVQVREEHGALIDAITVTEAKSMPDAMAINALAPTTQAGVLGTILLGELGFQAPPQQAGVTPDEYGTIELSAENLDLVDADLLFLEVREGTTEHENSPLWPTLDVVKNDGVVVVGNHWEFGGAVAARRVIEDVDAALDALAARRA